MAEVLLNDGATSFAAANWSDATGFADNADLTVGGGSQTISAGLDQSALTEGINRLTISGAFTGTIGSASSPLIVDVDGGTSPGSPVLRYFASGGRLHCNAGGDNALCVQLLHAGAGEVLTYGSGTITTLRQSLGSVLVNGGTVVTNAELYGGSGTFGYNATGFTSCIVTGGSWTFNRGGTFDIRGGNVLIDLSSGGTLTSLTVSNGAQVSILRADTVATFRLYGGVVDLRRIKKRSTIAATAGVIGPRSRASLLYDPNTVTIDSGLVFIGEEGGGRTVITG
jgi:hypothetical protein